MNNSSKPSKTKVEAKFIVGSVMRHVVVLTATASVGLVSIFAVDLVDLYFLSLLNEEAIIASLAFAAAITFFNLSFGIGLSVAMSATVAKAIGAKQDEQARSLALNNFIFSIVFSSIISLVTWVYRVELLQLVGATGDNLAYANRYLKIILPSLPILVIGMTGSGLIRAMGAPKLAMYALVIGAVVNLILDPIFIFGFNMGIEGAAWASVVSRFSVAIACLYMIYNKYDFYIGFSVTRFKTQLPVILAIAIPAMATMLATPFANAFMTNEIARFGEGYIAGWSLSGRITPVIFGVIFALSGAIGPIYGQNFGARKFGRVKQALIDSIKFVLAYCVFASLVFYLTVDYIIGVFGLSGDAENFMQFTAIWIGPAFAFYGMLFVANAAFNNLGYPLISTAFNFGKASIGTVPFVLYGASVMGAEGVFLGNGVGNIFFGIGAIICCLYIINKLANLNDGKGPEKGFRDKKKLF